MDKKILSDVEQYINIVKTIKQNQKLVVMNNDVFGSIINQLRIKNGENNEQNN